MIQSSAHAQEHRKIAPDDREERIQLETIADEAVAKFPYSIIDQRNYFIGAVRAVSDAPLAFFLFRKFIDTAVTPWLNDARRRARPATNPAKKTSAPRAVAASAPPLETAPPSPIAQEMAQRASRSENVKALGYVLNREAMVFFESITINGKKLGHTRVETARIWAARHHKQGAFILRLTDQMPQNALVGKLADEDSIVSAFTLANADTNAIANNVRASA